MKKQSFYYSAGVLALGLVAAGLWKPLHRMNRGQDRLDRIAQQGQPWNGGKPTAPVELESNIEGEIEPGEWVDVDLSLTPTTEGCVALSSRTRGMDGLEVSDDSVWNHPTCRQGERITRQIRVRAAEGVSGLVAVDLRMELDSGMVYEVTRSVAFRAEGTPILPGSE